MNKKPVVLLDACVLYPFYLRDFLVHLSFTPNLYYPRWTQLIQDEWARNLVKNVSSVDTKKSARIQRLMNEAIPDALISETEFRHLISQVSLPDSNDAHVLAAAMAGGVEAIMTFNTKHFPRAAIESHGLESVHPDDFILFLCSTDLNGVLKALAAQAAIMQNPPKATHDIVTALKRSGLPESCSLLERFL